MEPFGRHNSTIRASSRSIVRQYSRLALLRPTLSPSAFRGHGSVSVTAVTCSPRASTPKLRIDSRAWLRLASAHLSGPDGVDEYQIDASNENGELTVTLPKSVEAQKTDKTITIKAA
jgi:hypothetical protein